MVQELTLDQALVFTGYTGVVCCKVSDFQADVERRLGRSVFTHELANERVQEEIKKAYRDDFMAMVHASKSVPKVSHAHTNPDPLHTKT